MQLPPGLREGAQPGAERVGEDRQRRARGCGPGCRRAARRTRRPAPSRAETPPGCTRSSPSRRGSALLVDAEQLQRRTGPRPACRGACPGRRTASRARRPCPTSIAAASARSAASLQVVPRREVDLGLRCGVRSSCRASRGARSVVGDAPMMRTAPARARRRRAIHPACGGTVAGSTSDRIHCSRMPVVLRARALWKSYAAGVAGCSARVWVLKGASLEVEQGECVAILGAPRRRYDHDAAPLPRRSASHRRRHVDTNLSRCCPRRAPVRAPSARPPPSSCSLHRRSAVAGPRPPRDRRSLSLPGAIASTDHRDSRARTRPRLADRVLLLHQVVSFPLDRLDRRPPSRRAPSRGTSLTHEEAPNLRTTQAQTTNRYITPPTVISCTHAPARPGTVPS